jgi:hypothetical protein
MSTKSAMRGVPVTLLLDQSADETTSFGLAIPSSFKQHKITIKSGAGVVSGKVQPESADSPDYTGIWNPLGGGPIDVPAASSETEYNFSGIFSALRARIETAIGGGTITVIYVGST